MYKAFFLDRDGVINVDKSYVYKVEDFEFIDGVFDTLKYIQDKGYKLFIITNQSGIGRGYYTIENFLELTSWMKAEFEKNKIKIEEVQYCPHAPEENCNCRKPKTGMIDNILKNYEIDLENSWLVGDKDSDIKCANNANIKNSVQVKSGQKFDENKSDAKYVLENIIELKKLV
ncbi:D-glycero-beta-D-manno-heptose 1,7-bisphosphate 7-phosphatase [Arcobacter sp. CECT 8985]|uniref:D-glycero-beta-D-manno-heptose 1,7-bisphosphate 7-phosphatase n=1 Tax=Arcobacter sp. CECT 8985 TaxID=1935424 RepID=UPI00100BC9CE|nr:D-glycero-beta-D-manno-heptose 1,7-bisphosphate 7-phosphatase [Arcobacter sp. CECT 8985]RXJ85271.1 D-glycero-beta-D-manno-heptose-1,7-bisphosphate 7-phosphatase [Arcobacter sp. CECT 8985]